MRENRDTLESEKRSREGNSEGENERGEKINGFERQTIEERRGRRRRRRERERGVSMRNERA